MTFSAIYGTQSILSSRSSPLKNRWLPRDEMAIDLLSVGHLSIAGDMPAVCAASSSTAECLELLRDAGFQISSHIYRYRDANEYLELIKKLCGEGNKIVTQHVHAETDLPRSSCLIAPRTLSFINNKANLARFVPTDSVPMRRLVQVIDIEKVIEKIGLPAVIKATTDESSGGGVDVRICRNTGDLRAAAEYFMDCRDVVIEEYLDMRSNLCLNYSISKEGSITYLGYAGQVSDDEGGYQGNWIEDQPCAEEIIAAGIKVARTAFEFGYYGFMGMDVAVLSDGRFKIFDLNFRCNGSTPAVLFAEGIRTCLKKPVMRFRRFTGKADYRQMIQSVYQAMDKGMFLPLASCDPSAGPYCERRPVISGLILGETREDVLEKEGKLAIMGLNI